MGTKEIDNTGAILAFTFDINNSDELQQVKQFYEKAIEAGCRADMVAGPTEWTEYFASFKDPYGINWMISGE
ncbi:glyoxalase/bleomycin resistance/extradiol dioxygenase family protein [Jeotgalicoccus sp. WY2]|uniref:VOC family protein n=1 Tax=Jeotgalicoccus sp. WY2 TaxID=2708346 RepID=UPI001BD476DB|nr:VOC family protein [Jeotgalicoccus sp. WY2]